MKILMVHGDVRGPGQGGGAESLLRDQSRALQALGHDVAWWQGQGTIAQAVDSFKPDVVHLMTIHCYEMGIAPAVYCQEQHIPHVWHVQDYWPFCGGRMLLVDGDRSCSAVKGECDNECGGKVSGYLDIVNRSFVVAGNAHTAAIYRRNGMRCDAVCELGVDTDLFSPDHTQRPTDAVSIYTSSAWPEYPVKGMHVLTKAVQGTDHNVQLMTGLPRERVAKGLRRARIYVFPSCYEETWGLCLNEAMAAGCAVIASDVAGARAQVHDGLGVLVPPRDPAAIRAALDWLTRDHKTRETMGLLAREHAASDHSLEAMGRRWEAVYQEVIANDC